MFSYFFCARVRDCLLCFFFFQAEDGIRYRDVTGVQTYALPISIAEDKLNFNIGKPIDAVYRLRKGCERTVYFTDDYNNPRYYNFDKPQNFKNPNGTWVS